MASSLSEFSVFNKLGFLFHDLWPESWDNEQGQLSNFTVCLSFFIHLWQGLKHRLPRALTSWEGQEPCCDQSEKRWGLSEFVQMMRQDTYTEWKCKVANSARGSWKGELRDECRWGRGWERFRKGSIGCGTICCLASAFSICCDQMVCSDLSGQLSQGKSKTSPVFVDYRLCLTGANCPVA